MSLADRIVDGIVQLVISQELRDGDPLPSQDEMARLFGVSRPSLREALHRMEVLRLIEARQGRGTFVRDYSRLSLPSSAVPAPDYLTVAGLFTTLCDVEPAVAALAAINCDESAARILKECLGEGADAARARDLSAFLAHDLRFHSFIAEVSRAGLLAQTVEVARGLLAEAITAAIVVLPSDLDSCMERHEQVAGAVVSGDAKSAHQAMQAEADYTLEHNIALIRALAGADE